GESFILYITFGYSGKLSGINTGCCPYIRTLGAMAHRQKTKQEMRRVLILIGTVFSLTTFGQSAGDHLEPTGGYFNMYRHEYEYYPFIYKHLIKDISWNPIARVLTLPSFSPENVLSIESIDREEKIFKVIYKVCKESIWYREGDKNDIEVIKYEVGIDTTTVNLIRRVFTKAISETRYYEDPGIGVIGK